MLRNQGIVPHRCNSTFIHRAEITMIRAVLGHFLMIVCAAPGITDIQRAVRRGSGTDSDDWVWMECNPNGQWGRLPDSAAIADAFAAVMAESAEGSPA